MYDVVLALDSGVSCGVASGVVSHHRRSRDGRKAFSISSLFSRISLGTRKGKNNLFLQRSLPFLVLRSYSCLEEIDGFGAQARLQGVFFCVFLQEFERKNYKKACFPFSHVAIFSSHCDLLATFGDFWRDHDFDVVKGDQVSQTVEFPGISQEFFFLPWMPNTNNELFSSWDLRKSQRTPKTTRLPVSVTPQHETPRQPGESQVLVDPAFPLKCLTLTLTLTRARTLS